MRISIVIPTFNRGPALATTLSALLANNPEGLDAIEIIVVDDGSTAPASAVVNTFQVAPPFELRSVRQANAGPARARNFGFRSSHGQIVLFMDDDIISARDLVQKHTEAHRKRPGSVIFGRSLLPPPMRDTPLYKYLNSLGNDLGENAQEEFIESPLVASGHLSVERPMFAGRGTVYSENLVTPAAEEFELSYRLRKQGVPLLLATRIVATHDCFLDLEAVCRQQYKYGLGCGEVWEKCPETRQFCQLRRIVDPSGDRSFRRSMLQMRRLLNASAHSRLLFLRAAQLLEACAPIPGILSLVYRATLGLHFSCGIQDGLKRFSKDSASALGQHAGKLNLSEKTLARIRPKTRGDMT